MLQPLSIPFSAPNIGPKEMQYVNQALISGWVGSKGEYIDKFEAKFAKYIGVHHAITCSSGTTALFLAYLACGMRPESKVISTHHTFAATYNMLNVISRDVKLVKANIDTWTLNPVPVDNCDYFVGVHLYGNPCDMGNLYKTKYTFIEDCAQSLGSTFKGKKVGSFGAASTFSFHSAKTITTGEGGMICTNDKEIADKVRHFKSHCMTEPYKHDNLGWNFRMTNLQAALGLAQLERIDELLDKKLKIQQRYNELLSPKFVRQQETRNSRVCKWANAFAITGVSSTELRQKLLQSGIDTRPGFNREDIIVFPSGTTLTQHEQDYIITSANELVDA